MKDTDCSSTAIVGAQTDVAMGASPNYEITASETNPAGYVLNLCYDCEIKPTGKTPIKFSKPVTVTALALDCSSSLTPAASFVDPPSIPYNSGGTSSSIVIAADYETVYTHVQKNDCPLSSCSVFDSGCSVALGSTDVSLGSTPTFSLTASEVNPLGYTLTLCYKCII